MLAYLFWHRPLDRSATEAYERAQLAFHRSLHRTPPVGLRGSVVFRTREPPWLAPPADGGGGEPDGAGPVYEDWYLLEDFAALGVLNEATVGRGHRTAHDEAARRLGAGAGGLYGLIEGWPISDRPDAQQLDEVSLAVWISRPPGRPAGSQRCALGELLGDGIDPRRASLWRRHLALGPAPEFCLLASEEPLGVAPTRLPAGWAAMILEREALWHG